MSKTRSFITAGAILGGTVIVTAAVAPLFLLAMQSNGALCQMLALDILFGLPLDAFERQTVAIRNMELDQVNAFIKKVLDPAQPRSWSIVRPPLS